MGSLELTDRCRVAYHHLLSEHMQLITYMVRTTRVEKGSLIVAKSRWHTQCILNLGTSSTITLETILTDDTLHTYTQTQNKALTYVNLSMLPSSITVFFLGRLCLLTTEEKYNTYV